MITVIDYGMGNLRSVSKALEHLGARVTISSSLEAIREAQKIVLPGVGAFGAAMKELQSRNLIKPICDHFNQGKKILGICLGMQLVFNESDESPGVKGLDIISGTVKPFATKNVKIPHMGWNTIKINAEHPLLMGINDNSFFYFVHSFVAAPINNNVVMATSTHGTQTFPAMIGTEHSFFTQFHPEKSQSAGLQILKNFVGW